MPARIEVPLQIRRAIEVIRQFRHENSEIFRGLSFVFDKPLSEETKSCEFVVMGANPKGTGEPTNMEFNGEETSLSSWRNGIASPAETRWRQVCTTMLKTNEIVLTESFFWASENRTHLAERYGPAERVSRIYEFCARQNQILIESRRPRAVIVTALGLESKISKFHSLRRAGGSDALHRKKFVRLVKKTDGTRPWFFISHPTAAWGIDDEDRKAFRDYILENC